MKTTEHTYHANTYLVRKDGMRFKVAEIESGQIETYLHDLEKEMPQSNWGIEKRFPVCGTD